MCDSAESVVVVIIDVVFVIHGQGQCSGHGLMLMLVVMLLLGGSGGGSSGSSSRGEARHGAVAVGTGCTAGPARAVTGNGQGSREVGR
jgi:hypothetical protein